MTDQRPQLTAAWRKIISSMSPRAIIREALRALFRNKLRSTLTVLGITIGIGAVICVVAIGQAGSAQVEEQLNNLGDNFVWIEAGSRAPSGIRTGSHGTKTLLQSDVEAILKQVPLIKLASANVDSQHPNRVRQQKLVHRLPRRRAGIFPDQALGDVAGRALHPSRRGARQRRLRHRRDRAATTLRRRRPHRQGDPRQVRFPARSWACWLPVDKPASATTRTTPSSCPTPRRRKS